MDLNTKKAIFLTIGIPTYKRNASLFELLDQISHVSPSIYCEILVINNGPEFNFSKYFKKLNNAGYLVTFIQNKVNCGGQENILRIYENAKGNFIWMLGDDDRIYKNSINIVLESLRKHNCDCLMFNAQSGSQPTINLKSSYYNFDEIFSNKIPLRKLMFAPLNVIKKSRIQESLYRARLNLNTFAPQLLIILYSKIDNFYFLNENIIHADNVNIISAQRLSSLPVFLGIAELSTINFSNNINKKISKLIKSEGKYFLNTERMIANFMINRVFSDDKNLMLFVKASFKNYYFIRAIIFSIAVVIISIIPKNIIKFILEFVINDRLKKNIILSEYVNYDRI